MSAPPRPLGHVPTPRCPSTLAQSDTGGLSSGCSLPEDGGPGPWAMCAPARAMGREALVQSPWAIDLLSLRGDRLLAEPGSAVLRTLPFLAVGRQVLGTYSPCSGGACPGCPLAGPSQGVPSDLPYCSRCCQGAPSLCLARNAISATCIILYPSPEVALLSLPLLWKRLRLREVSGLL